MNKLFDKNNKNNVEFNLQSILDFLTENMIFNYQGELIQIKDNIASVVNKKEVQVLILEELKKENDPSLLQCEGELKKMPIFMCQVWNLKD